MFFKKISKTTIVLMKYYSPKTEIRILVCKIVITNENIIITKLGF